MTHSNEPSTEGARPWRSRSRPFRDGGSRSVVDLCGRRGRVLKHSPFASSIDLDAAAAIFEAQSDRDPDRAEFYELFLAARRLL